MTDNDNVINIRKNAKETVKVHMCSKCSNSLYYAGLDGSLICSTCRVRVAKCKVYLDAVNDPE